MKQSGKCSNIDLGLCLERVFIGNMHLTRILFRGHCGNFGRGERVLENSGMRYTFEKVKFEKRFQVRLKGEFIMYVKEKDSAFVDRVLEEKGYTSRKQYHDMCVERIIRNMAKG